MGSRKMGNPIQRETKEENNEEKYQDDDCIPIK